MSEGSEIFQRMIQRKGFWAELRAANALAIKQWKVEFSYPLSVLWFILMPFLWFIPMLIAGSAVAGGTESQAFYELAGTSDWISYIAIGMAFSGLTMSLFWGTGMALRREQNVGTLETLMTTPVNRSTLVWGSMLHNLQHGGLGVLMQLVVSIFLFGVTLNVWGILPALLVIGLAIIGFQGVILTLVCIVLIAKQGWMIVEFVSSSLMLVAPISYPIIVLPSVLQSISVASPLTWSVDLFRSFLMYGFNVPGASSAILILIVLDMIYFTFGLLMFRATEAYVRKKGALSQF